MAGSTPAHQRSATTRRAKKINPARLDFEPALTIEEVFSAEAEYNNYWRGKRTVTLMTLTQTRVALIDGFLDKEAGPDVMFGVCAQITEFREHLKAVVELADSAIARIIAAGYAAAAIEGVKQ